MKRILFFLLIAGFSIPLPAQDEASICRYLFSSSKDVTILSTDAISLAVDAVWAASEITGVATITGTLTQNPYNQDNWTYSSNPNDKLVLQFANGVTVVFTFYSINGYTGGTEEDFKLSHSMDFNTYVENRINMRIQSNTYPQGGKTYWQRTITGTVPFDSQTMTVNISHTGNLDYYVESPWAYYKYVEDATGTSNAGSFSVTINEFYRRTIMHNSDARVFVLNTEIGNNSSGNFSGTTYQFQNAYVFWAAGTAFADSAHAGFYNNVIDANDWEVSGTMLKNGQQYGTVQFSGPVISGTYGPDLVLRLQNGTEYFLHTLIAGGTTHVVQKEDNSVNDYVLMQNYPNPFNPSTAIHFSIPERQNVRLSVYDLLGREVARLVDEEKEAGWYSVVYNAAGLASGVYFYKIQTESFVSAKRFILSR